MFDIVVNNASEYNWQKQPPERPATLLKKRLYHRCFPVNFAKFLRTSFLQNTSGDELKLYLFFLQVAEFDWDSKTQGKN